MAGLHVVLPSSQTGPLVLQVLPPSSERATLFSWFPTAGSPAQTSQSAPLGALANSVVSPPAAHGARTVRHAAPALVVWSIVAAAPRAAGGNTMSALPRLGRTSHVESSGSPTAERSKLRSGGCRGARAHDRPPLVDTSSVSSQAAGGFVA